MKITELSLKRPVTVFMILVAFIVAGIITSRMLPLEFFPNVEFPYVYVYVPYSSSSPEQVEEQITKPVEEVLSTLSNIKRIISKSKNSGVGIFIEFKWGTNATIKTIEAREKIDSIKADLPKDIQNIYMGKESSADIPMLELIISSDTRDISESYDVLKKQVKNRIERIDGVSKADIYGISYKYYSINLNADLMKTHKVDLKDLVDTLKASNFSVTAGQITDKNIRYTVRPVDELKKPSDIENLIIGENDLKLVDVADISYTMDKNDYRRRHLNGKTAIGLDIMKESGANIVDISREVKKQLELLKKRDDLKGINIYPVHDSADAIIGSLNELLKSGLFGFALSFIILFIFLRQIQSTMIVAISVPFSIFVTIVFMYFIGLSMNILTMLGLLLAVGMVVDNSVVVTENIFKNRNIYSDGAKAAIISSKEINLAITAGTLTTVIVFLPNILGADSMITFYIKHIGLSFSIALLTSLVIAQTVVPLLASKIKQKPDDAKTLWIDKLSQRYKKILAWLIVRRKISILLMILLAVSIIIPVKFVKSEMFSSSAQRKITIRYNINDSYTPDKVGESVKKIENYLLMNKKRFEIEFVYTSYNGNYAKTRIYLTKGDDVIKKQSKIQEMIKKNLPEIAIGKPAFKRTSSGGNNESLNIMLRGATFQDLQKYSEKVIKYLRTIEKIGDIQTDISAEESEIVVKINKDKTRKYNISPGEIARHISLAMRGTDLKSIQTKDGEIDLFVVYRDEDRKKLSNLKNITMYKDGKEYKLATLAKFIDGKGPSEIYHESRKTSLSIIIDKGDLTVLEAKNGITKSIESIDLPANISWGFGSAFEFEDETQDSMLINTLLALALIYLVMASLFESVFFPIAIWVSIIYAVVGVYWLFFVTFTTFDFLSWIGVLVLIGVVVNNGIVFLDHLIHLRNKGMERYDAIIQAGSDRLRPILMTAGTTILSLIPLCFNTKQVGGSGPPYFSLGRAIVGGMLLSTLVTLIILPTIYIIIDDLVCGAKNIVRKAYEKQ